ncbi:MAG: hypothetical protein IJR61_02905 [Clostridia bacterium]|nr:hypothetical protein [Clostridia bacterium]
MSAFFLIFSESNSSVSKPPDILSKNIRSVTFSGRSGFHGFSRDTDFTAGVNLPPLSCHSQETVVRSRSKAVFL